MLRPDEYKKADTHQLLRSQQHILVISRYSLLQFSSPELLIGCASSEIKNASFKINQIQQVSKLLIQANKLHTIMLTKPWGSKPKPSYEWCSNASQQRHRLYTVMTSPFQIQPHKMLPHFSQHHRQCQEPGLSFLYFRGQTRGAKPKNFSSDLLLCLELSLYWKTKMSMVLHQEETYLET